MHLQTRVVISGENCNQLSMSFCDARDADFAYMNESTGEATLAQVRMTCASIFNQVLVLTRLKHALRRTEMDSKLMIGGASYLYTPAKTKFSCYSLNANAAPSLPYTAFFYFKVRSSIGSSFSPEQQACINLFSKLS